LPADALESLRRRAEEALAEDGVERARLGYDVSMLKRSYRPKFLDCYREAVSDDGGHAEITAT
jgi:hypothetical protein